jgi:DNA-binding NarL/FixJ family response regulator
VALAHQRLREIGVRPVNRGPHRSTRAHPAGLTSREAEILGLISGGSTNREIAESLYLSPKTVEHHVSAILAKLDVPTRREAVRVAADLGLAPAATGQA